MLDRMEKAAGCEPDIMCLTETFDTSYVDEQKPYAEIFSKIGISFKYKTLKTGDYSIEGYENKFAIERNEKYKSWCYWCRVSWPISCP